MADAAQVPDPVPTFPHHERICAGRERLFEVFQLSDAIARRALFASLLVENAIVLLSGTYGTGKTQLVHLVKKLLFGDGQGGYLYDWESCHQELTAFDVLYHLDLAELQAGREVVHPKAMVSARLKFLNEIQRASPGLFNALLPLFAERRLTYRDHDFATPEFLCIMDRNPLDTGSSEVPEAFLDRIDYGFDIPAVHLEDMLRIQDLRRRPDGYHWGGLEEMLEPAVAFAELAEVWRDVRRVAIPRRQALIGGMITDAFRLCVVTERSNARPDFDLECDKCQYRGEVCAHLLRVPGLRVTNSVLRLAQALAWLDHEVAVEDRHVVLALPWALAHRVALRPEELRTEPSAESWVRRVGITKILGPKTASWNRALEAVEAGRVEELREMSANDLVVLQLLAVARG